MLPCLTTVESIGMASRQQGDQILRFFACLLGNYLLWTVIEKLHK
jgi:hypothetical protein